MRFALEAGDPENAGLGHAREVLEAVKAKHPGLSAADLWVLAGYVAIEHMGGPHIDFHAGRTDAEEVPACEGERTVRLGSTKNPAKHSKNAVTHPKHYEDAFYFRSHAQCGPSPSAAHDDAVNVPKSVFEKSIKTFKRSPAASGPEQCAPQAKARRKKEEKKGKKKERKKKRGFFFEKGTGFPLKSNAYTVKNVP